MRSGLRARHRSAISEIAEVICVSTPARFMAVGEWYHDFGQTSDDEVVELLDKGVSVRLVPSIGSYER